MKEKWGGALFLEIKRYFNLKIAGHSIECPYFSNEIGMHIGQMMTSAGVSIEAQKNISASFLREGSYGRYKGKGTPQQIEDAALEFIAKNGYDVATITPEGARLILQFMLLGVDCSGFVFNVLNAAFCSVGKQDWVNSLEFVDPNRRDVYRASVGVFAGRASFLVEDMQSLRDGDLILIKDKQGKYIHIAIITKEWDVVGAYHSSAFVSPSGVQWFEIANNGQKLDFVIRQEVGSDWNKLKESGRLEIRRLNAANI